jgi:hypothetical protein
MNTHKSKISAPVIICLYVLGMFYACSAANENRSDEELFTQANEAYKKGAFALAYDDYQKITNKGCAVHYNMGNCAYKLSNYGYALLHWRRAERDWGFWGREELNKNIELVKKQMTPQQPSQEASGLSTIIDFFKSNKNAFFASSRATTLFHLQIIVLLVWICLFCYLRYLYKRKQKVVIFTLFLLQAVFTFMLAIKYNSQFREFAIITSQQATLLSGPGSTFTQLQRLPEAQEAVIIGSSGDYYKIRVNGRIGWLTKTSIEKI